MDTQRPAQNSESSKDPQPNNSAVNPLDGGHKYLTPTGDTVFVEVGTYDEADRRYPHEYHADVYELPDGTRVAKLM